VGILKIILVLHFAESVLHWELYTFWQSTRCSVKSCTTH